MNSVAAVLNWHPTARVRLGGGPALHRAQYTDSMSDIPRGTASRSGPGLVGQAGFAWFNGERMFSELTAEYSLAPSMDRPEVVVTNPGFNGITSTATLPAASISYSQWSVGISFGVKLWR